MTDLLFGCFHNYAKDFIKSTLLHVSLMGGSTNCEQGHFCPEQKSKVPMCAEQDGHIILPLVQLD